MILLSGSSFATQENSETQNPENMKITITIGEQKLTATIENNTIGKDFIASLPITVELEDYAGLEKIFYPKRKLNTHGSTSGYNPEVGDITYYAPWGNIAIFYKDFGYASGLIKIGKIEGDMSILKNSKKLQATFEAAE